jgi:hypothetical protein
VKRNLLLAAFAVVIALILVELVLRTTHLFNARLSWTQPDPEIAWCFTPGRAYRFLNENDHAITGRINALGWRDRERDRTKRVDTRVAVVGDSYVEAFQVELDSTFGAVAERTLQARGARTWEFMSFGRSGMGSAEERIVLQRDVLPCAPDVVVLLFAPINDIADAARATVGDAARPFYVADERDSLVLDTSFKQARGYRVRALLNPLRQRSVLVSLVMERYRAARFERALRAAEREAASSPNQLTALESLMTSHPDPMFLASYALAKRIVRETARECAPHAAFVLMSVPVAYEDADVAELRAREGTFDPDFFDRDLAAMADTAGFAFIPLTEAFAKRSREIRSRLHWAHWNYAGHRLVGETLADTISALWPPPDLRE